MKREKEQSWNLLRTFVCVTLAGTMLHGLFDLWPSILTEFVAPVNESIWEHMKIVFWPLLVGLTMLYDKGKWGSVLLSVLLCCGLMLAFGWGCHVGLGLAPGFVDIVCYVLLMALGCLLPDWLKVPEGWTGWLICATILLVGLLITFTIMPPRPAIVPRCVLGGCVGGTYLVTKEDKIDKGTDGGFVQFVDEAALLSGGRG